MKQLKLKHKKQISQKKMVLQKKKYIVFIFFFQFVCVSQNFAQTKTDSLTSQVDILLAQGNDSSAIKILLELYQNTRYTDPFLPIQYAAQAKSIYEKNKDSTGMAFMYRYIADVYSDRKIYYMAILNYTKSFEIFNATHNKFEKANLYLRIGDSYLAQRLDANAAKRFNKAKVIFEKIDNKEGIAEVLDRLGLLQASTSYDAALKQLNEALKIRLKLNNSEQIAHSYESFADFYISSEEYEIAIEYLKKTQIKYKLAKNAHKTALIYSKLGELFSILGNYKNAEQNYSKALLLYGNIGIPYETAKTYAKIAHINIKLKEYETAHMYTDIIMSQSKLYDFQDLKLDAYLLYAQIYSGTNQYEKASQYFSLHNNLGDSIKNKTESNHANETQILLVTSGKEKEIEILENQQKLNAVEIKRQNAEAKSLYAGLALFAIIVLFTLIFGFYLYRANKKTKRANSMLIEKNEEINQQKEKILLQNTSLEEANVAITIAKDEIENKNDKIESSINYASRIQRAMLPKMAEIREELPESFVMLSPRDAVSGDFFWYGVVEKKGESKKIIIAAIDCTGHGVPGAFMSMIGDSYLNQIIMQQKITSPDIILEELHKGVRRALQQDKTDNNDGMDMAVCVIDKQQKTLEFAGAKNPLVYIQDNKLNLIKGDSFSIGGLMRARRKAGFNKHIIDISKPITFYIYSDGYQDQFGQAPDGRIRKYMAKRFRNFIFETHNQPINEQAVSFAVEFDKWRNDKEQMDDVLLVGVRLAL